MENIVDPTVPTVPAVVSSPPSEEELLKVTASRIASGELSAPDSPARRIRAARKDYNAKGRCNEHWFRLAFRGGAWVYLGDRRLNNGTFLAADRRDTVYDDVFAGELIAQHDRGGPVDQVFLVIDRAEKPLIPLTFGKTRDGRLRVELPTGAELRLPNPRR